MSDNKLSVEDMYSHPKGMKVQEFVEESLFWKPMIQSDCIRGYFRGFDQDWKGKPAIIEIAPNVKKLVGYKVITEWLRDHCEVDDYVVLEFEEKRKSSDGTEYLYFRRFRAVPTDDALDKIQSEVNAKTTMVGNMIAPSDDGKRLLNATQ